jgi:hypothetical protein
MNDVLFRWPRAKIPMKRPSIPALFAIALASAACAPAPEPVSPPAAPPAPPTAPAEPAQSAPPPAAPPPAAIARPSELRAATTPKCTPRTLGYDGSTGEVVVEESLALDKDDVFFAASGHCGAKKEEQGFLARIPRAGGDRVEIHRGDLHPLLVSTYLSDLVVGMFSNVCAGPAVPPVLRTARIPKGGGRLETMRVRHGAGEFLMSLAADDSGVYFTTAGGRVERIDRAGAHRVLASGVRDAHGVLPAGGHVYFASSDGTVLRVAKDGQSTATVIARGVEVIRSHWWRRFVIDERSLYYFGSPSDPNSKDPRLYRTGLTGGEPVEIAGPQHDPRGLVAARGLLVWSDYAEGGRKAGAIRAVSRDGGEVVTLLETGWVQALTGDERDLFWIEDRTIRACALGS